MMAATCLTPLVDDMVEAPIWPSSGPRREALHQLRWAEPSPLIPFLDSFQVSFFVVFAKIQRWFCFLDSEMMYVLVWNLIHV
jgi:hypothetical protein